MNKSLSTAAAKVILAEMFKTGESATEVADRLALWMPSPEETASACFEVVRSERAIVARCVGGNKSLLNVLIGKVLKSLRMRPCGEDVRLLLLLILESAQVVYNPLM